MKCRRLQASTQVQWMSDPPADRLAEEGPCTYSTVDLFEPCRNVYIETECSLDTSSFNNSFPGSFPLEVPVDSLNVIGVLICWSR